MSRFRSTRSGTWTKLRFVLLGAAELLRIAALETNTVARRHAKRVEIQVRDALENDLRRQAEARTLGEQRVLAATMGLSEAQLEILRAALTRPRCVTIGEHTVSVVPTDRAIVVHETVYEVLRRPLEESGRHLAAAMAARKRPRGKRGAPDTRRGGDVVAIAAQLRAEAEADDAQCTERAQKCVEKAAARADKKTIELREALEGLIASSYDISGLVLPKISALLRWQQVPVPTPFNTAAKPAAIAAWNAKKISQNVLYAEHEAMVAKLAAEDEFDEDMVEDEDEDD
jgi:hypothetical protein